MHSSAIFKLLLLLQYSSVLILRFITHKRYAFFCIYYVGFSLVSIIIIQWIKIDHVLLWIIMIYRFGHVRVLRRSMHLMIFIICFLTWSQILRAPAGVFIWIVGRYSAGFIFISRTVAGRCPEDNITRITQSFTCTIYIVHLGSVSHNETPKPFGKDNHR